MNKLNCYGLETSLMAKRLLGQVLVRVFNGRALRAMICETEAYLHSGDAASHSASGPSRRNAVMFGPAGRLYVYISYGIHHCINVVTMDEGLGAAVLIRAMQPIDGISTMIDLRGTGNIKNLCRGPGNVGKAFGFSLEDNGSSLMSDKIWIEDRGEIAADMIVEGQRIGISKSKELPLRYYMANSPYVSGKKLRILEKKL